MTLLRLVFISFVMCMFCFSLQANMPDYDLKQVNYALGLDVGLSTTRSLNSSHAFTVGYSTFSYTPYQNHVNPYRFGIAVKKNIGLSHHNFLQTGLSYHQLSAMRVFGALEQGISPPFFPFGYDYSVNNKTTLVEAKLIHQWHNQLYPYVLGGIGAAFNTVKNFVTDVPDYVTITPSFADNKTTSFSYILGLGVDFIHYHPLSIGLGYRFSDLGPIGLGSAQIRNTRLTNPIKQPHLYLNTVLIELNCLFNV